MSGGKREKHKLTVKIHKSNIKKPLKPKTAAKKKIRKKKSASTKLNSTVAASKRRKKNVQPELLIKPKKESKDRNGKSIADPAPQARIISMESEKSKKALMWSLVAFFMLLFFALWTVNTYKMIVGGKPDSGKGISFDEINKDLEDRIREFEEDIQAIRDYAGSIEDEDDKNNVNEIISSSTNAKIPVSAASSSRSGPINDISSSSDDIGVK